MIKSDFNKLRYDKIIIENKNFVKVLIGKYLMMVHEEENEKDVIYSIFENRELILAYHTPLDKLINSMNSFTEDCYD